MSDIHPRSTHSHKRDVSADGSASLLRTVVQLLRVSAIAASTHRDVDDLATTGKGNDKFAIQLSSNYSAGGVLKEGNIKIR